MYRISRVIATSDKPEFSELMQLHYNDEMVGYLAAENRTVLNVILDMALRVQALEAELEKDGDV